MANRKPNLLRGSDECVTFIDFQVPTRNEAVEAEQCKQDRRNEYALVNQNGIAATAKHPDEDADRRDRPIEIRRNPTPIVVREEIWADIARRIQIFGK